MDSIETLPHSASNDDMLSGFLIHHVPLCAYKIIKTADGERTAQTQTGNTRLDRNVSYIYVCTYFITFFSSITTVFVVEMI